MVPAGISNVLLAMHRTFMTGDDVRSNSQLLAFYHMSTICEIVWEPPRLMFLKAMIRACLHYAWIRILHLLGRKFILKFIPFSNQAS